MFCHHPVVKLSTKSLLANLPGWILTAGSKASVTARYSIHISEFLEKEKQRRLMALAKSKPKMSQTGAKLCHQKCQIVDDTTLSPHFICFHLYFLYINVFV